MAAIMDHFLSYPLALTYLAVPSDPKGRNEGLRRSVFSGLGN